MQYDEAFDLGTLRDHILSSNVPVYLYFCAPQSISSCGQPLEYLRGCEKRKRYQGSRGRFFTMRRTDAPLSRNEPIGSTTRETGRDSSGAYNTRTSRSRKQPKSS